MQTSFPHATLKDNNPKVNGREVIVLTFNQYEALVSFPKQPTASFWWPRYAIKIEETHARNSH